MLGVLPGLAWHLIPNIMGMGLTITSKTPLMSFYLWDEFFFGFFKNLKKYDFNI